MLTRRLVINLVAFFLAAAVLVTYGVIDLLGNPFKSATVLTADFPDASGLNSNFTVELNGVPVGTVDTVALTSAGVKIDMTIQPGTTVPGDVEASIDIANDLGEQVVELTPMHGGTAPALKSGAVVPVNPNSIPADVGQVVATATKLLQAIPPGQLNELLSELAQGLAGQASNLRTIINSGSDFEKEFLNYQNQFKALLANAPPVLSAVASVGLQLQQALVNTESLVQVLAARKTDLTNLLAQGATSTGQLGNLIESQAPNLACVIHDLADVVANVSQPANLANLSESFADNTYFFGAVQNVAQPGLAKPLTSTQSPIPNQLMLRTRLLFPPAMPSALAYSSTVTIPNILPGAGCSTEYGNGVGPATQANFTPAAGGTVVAPTAAEATVRGGATAGAPLVSNVRAAYVQPATNMASTAALMALGAIVVPGLFLVWMGRPSRRRRRRYG